MFELNKIAESCDTTVQFLIWGIVFIVTASGIAIRTLWKALQDERAKRDEQDKDNLLVLKDVTNVLEIVSGNVKTIPSDIKEAIKQTEDRIKEIISKMNEG